MKKTNYEARDPKEVREELDKKILDGVEAMLDSDKYKQYLDFCSKMPKRSFNNQMLIFVQRPDASLCLGFKQWKNNFERHVVKGAKGIKILAPCIKTVTTVEQLDRMFEKEFYRNMFSEEAIEAMYTKVANGQSVQFISGFKPATVFDISDTEGKELPNVEICQLLEGDVENYNKIFDTLSQIAGIPIEFKTKDNDSTLSGGARGYYSPYSDTITLLDGMSEVQTISTLVHEITHSIMHSKEMKAEGIHETTTVRGIKELQAESVSYMVCQRLGIETEAKSFGYIASWVDKGNKEETLKTMREHLDVISKCSNYIISGLEKNLAKTQELTEDLTEEEEEVRE